MVNLSTAQITGIVSLALILSGAVIVNNLEKTYYCEPEDNVRECLRISASGITCYYLLAENLTKGDRCTGGVWKLLDSHLDSQADIRILSGGHVKVRANGKEWICQGMQPYSRCTSKQYSAYYGELA